MKFVSVLACVAVGLASSVCAVPALAQITPFYAATEAEVAGGPPGSIIRSEALRGPWNSKAYRILYRSTGLNNEPIAVSGMLVIPTAAPPPGGHPVVAWAHPTVGVADKCAPSAAMSEDFQTIPGLDLMVQRGYVVVATDYPGLGTAGQHPYLIGISEGRAVLDSVRAAIAAGGASNRFAVWGHSQGGHAALWAGQLAKSYAPDLSLVGIAAAAPATHLGELFDDDLGTVAGTGLSALALWAWSNLYDIPMGSIVKANQIKAVEAIGGQCLSGFSDVATDVAAIAHIGKGSFLLSSPRTTPPWSEITKANSPGGEPAGGPVFLAQGSADTIVDPPVTTQFATQLCNEGVAVTFHEVPDATHQVIAKVSAQAAVDWMAARFDGQPAPTNCVKR